MKKMDHHRWSPPLDELQLITDGGLRNRKLRPLRSQPLPTGFPA
jgi:hypothetical protein